MRIRPVTNPMRPCKTTPVSLDPETDGKAPEPRQPRQLHSSETFAAGMHEGVGATRTKRPRQNGGASFAQDKIKWRVASARPLLLLSRKSSCDVLRRSAPTTRRAGAQYSHDHSGVGGRNFSVI
jgi:hypothetical protein